MEKNSSDEEKDPCFVYPTPFLREQFFLVFVVGTCISLLSLSENSLLLRLFWLRPRFRDKHYFYLFILSAFDILNSLAYIAVFSTCILYEYTENGVLMRAWFRYVIPAFTLMHLLRASSVFLLVAVSLERYLSANWFSGFCTTRKRSCIVLIVIGLSFVFRGTTPWELRVDYRPNCSEMKQYQLETTPFLRTDFGVIWTFWVRNTGTVLVPFVLLLGLNSGIVYRDKCACLARGTDDGKRTLVQTVRQVRARFYNRTNSLSSMGNISSIMVENAEQEQREQLRNSVATEWVRRARSRVHRTATRTLIAIVSTFLVVSSLSVVVTVWEQVAFESLDTDYNHFYTISSDLVSLLSIVASSARLPTYFACDHRFREEFLTLYCPCLPSKQKRRERNLSNRRRQQAKSTKSLGHVALTALHSRRNLSSNGELAENYVTRTTDDNFHGACPEAEEAVPLTTMREPPKATSDYQVGYKEVERSETTPLLLPKSALLKSMKCNSVYAETTAD